MKHKFISLAIAFIFLPATSLATAITISFNQSTLGGYAQGTNITREFFSQGVIFSNDPMGLDGDFWGLGWQENRISTGNFLDNPFRIDFTYPAPVYSFEAALLDGNLMYQIHNLFAFDWYGNILDWCGFADTTNDGITHGLFTLSVASTSPIASVLFYEQNYGGDYGKNGGKGYEALSWLRYTVGAPILDPDDDPFNPGYDYGTLAVASSFSSIESAVGTTFSAAEAPAPVPEPATMALMGLGLMMIFGGRFFRKIARLHK